MCQLWESPHCVIPGLPEFSYSRKKTSASVLKERKQPAIPTSKAPNQDIQRVETSKITDTGLPPSQETVNFSLPQHFHVKKEALADLFRFLKQMQLILAKVPNVKKTLEELEKTEDPYNKLFIMPEEISDNT
ncbi:hypothetical protein AVEN_51185-1 [Araneus ventricosus]|uniref:Uncharacterized protein n=1 Tax=Araneus ventricosus TaxID=182803 RepID=A0A4Y2RP13_ARAVE|nr:hypothetical protein AVEN_51185-1 [Araneus ventricosus]